MQRGKNTRRKLFFQKEQYSAHETKVSQNPKIRRENYALILIKFQSEDKKEIFKICPSVCRNHVNALV